LSGVQKKQTDRRTLQRNFRELQSVLEGLLFASRNKGITIDDLAAFIEDKKGEELLWKRSNVIISSTCFP